MARVEEAPHPAEGRVEIVAVPLLVFSGVYSHPHPEKRLPGEERPLRVEGGVESVVGAGEHHTESVADGFEDAAIVEVRGFGEDFVVARESGSHGVGVPLPQLCGAFYVGEKESALDNGGHRRTPHLRPPL